MFYGQSLLCMPILDRIEQISTYYVVHIMHKYDNVIKYNVRRIINFYYKDEYEDDNYDDDNMRVSDAWSDESYENDEVTENDGNTSLYLMVSVCF